MISSLLLGLQRHPWRFIASILLSYSVLWTLVESFSYFNPVFSAKGLRFQISAILISIVIGIYRAYQPRKATIKINTSDTVLNIFFDDLFQQNGYISIPVNEYFDSHIGEPVSPNSLHGIFINNYFGGHPESFEKLVDRSLQLITHETVNREIGRTNKYPIGTTAKLIANNQNFMLVALCHTDLETYKATADVPQLWAALTGLFSTARNLTAGDSLSIPLIGSGLSGIGLPATQILQLIVLAIISETKKKQICKEINIVLHESRFSEIDLEMIKKQWS